MVLHQCIRPLVGALLRAIMDISARAISLADRPQPSHSGHQCSHTPGRPILHRRLKSSRRPRQAGKWLRHQWLSFSLKVPLFAPGAVPSSRPALGQRRRAQRRSRLAGVRLAQPVPALPGHALTGSSTGRRHLSAAGRLISLLAFEVAVLTEDAQAIRASLLASAMASTLGCSRLFAAVIHCLSP